MRSIYRGKTQRLNVTKRFIASREIRPRGKRRNGSPQGSSPLARIIDLKSAVFMSSWRRLPLTLMALFALCALMLPSLVWACPMSGRVGNATQVCRATTENARAAMPCCAKNRATPLPSCLGKCCKPIPQLPSQDSNKNSALHPVNANFSGLLDQLSQTAYPIITPASPVAPLVIEPTTRATWDDSPVPLLPAQFAPGSLLGRAPPRQF